MNAFSTIDIDAAAPEFSLATVETLTPAIVFVPGGVEKIVSKLEAEVRAIPRDISTEKGREAVKSLAYKVARSKTGLDEMGKETVAGIKKQSGLIDADRRIIRDRLDALRDEVRADLTAYEAAEEARVDGHEKAIVRIIEMTRFSVPPGSKEIRACIIEVKRIWGPRGWDEFYERAEAAVTDALALLETMLATAEQAERDAAELAELRRMKAEREASDQAEAEAKARAERIAKDAEEVAERARLRAEQIDREKQAAAAGAIEQERRRVAAAQAAEEAAAKKREANKRHRAKIIAEISDDLGRNTDLRAEDIAPLIEAIAAGSIRHVSITY